MAESIRVLIVDDQFIIRIGLRGVLSMIEGIEIVGEAENGREAVELTRTTQPDIVLMDLCMPEMDGLEATRAIHEHWPEVGIVVLTSIDIGEEVLGAVRAGAMGYIDKLAHQQEIQEALLKVYRGEPSLPPELTRRLLGQWSNDSHHPPSADSLTKREGEILCKVAKGLSNQEIAETVHITEATVRTHVTRIFGKLGVRNRVEATLCAMKTGMASLAEESNSTGHGRLLRT